MPPDRASEIQAILRREWPEYDHPQGRAMLRHLERAYKLGRAESVAKDARLEALETDLEEWRESWQ